MYSIAFSVSTTESFTYEKFREIARLKEKISELEIRIQTLIEDSKSARALDTTLDATSSVKSVYCLVSAVEPMQQGNWVTVRCCNHRTKHHSSVSITITNRFSPLSETPTVNSVESALVNSDSIARNVKIETTATIVKCRVPEIKANLKVLANANRTFSRIIIHVGTNAVRLCQSEITKINVKEVCELASSY